MNCLSSILIEVGKRKEAGSDASKRVLGKTIFDLKLAITKLAVEL